MGKFPSDYCPKTDEERIQNLSAWFDKFKDMEWEVTSKDDGSSLTMFYSPTIDSEIPFGVCTRNLRIKSVDSKGVVPLGYQMASKYDVEAKLKAYTEETKVELAFQGELVGPGIQKDRDKYLSHEWHIFKDMDALNEETAIVPMLASGMQVGEVYFSVLDGVLTVDALLTAEGSIDKATVYIAPDAITASTLGSNRFTGVKSKLAREIDLGDTPYATVMVQLTVTYDPATAQIFEIGEAEEEALEEQQHAWELMQLTTANEAVG